MSPEDAIRSLSGSWTNIRTTPQQNYFIPEDAELSPNRGTLNTLRDYIYGSEPGRRLMSAVDFFNSLTGGPSQLLGNITTAGDILPFRTAEKIAPIATDGHLLEFKAPTPVGKAWNEAAHQISSWVKDTSHGLWRQSIGSNASLGTLAHPPTPQMPLRRVFEEFQRQGIPTDQINEGIRYLVRSGQAKVENDSLIVPWRKYVEGKGFVPPYSK